MTAENSSRNAEIERLVEILAHGNDASRKETIAKLREEGWFTDGALAHVHLDRLDLKGLDLAGINLRSGYLEKSSLSRTDLSVANLQQVILHDAKLVGANLMNAKLQRASLIGADLSGANLTGACLRGAFLQQACFMGANLTNADLRGARYAGLRVDLNTILPDGNKWMPNAEIGEFFNSDENGRTIADLSDIASDLERLMESERREAEQVDSLEAQEHHRGIAKGLMTALFEIRGYEIDRRR